MYIPKHFECPDAALALSIVDENAFGVFLSETSPVAITHLPMIVERRGADVAVLIGHFAKPNPHCARIDGETPATAIFSGPHAYVSPNWYATPNLVPTWNYAAVHVSGTPRAVDDPARTEDILQQLVRRFESDATGNWSMDALTEGRLTGQMKGIVAFEMPILHIDAKLKMSQNRADADIDGVSERLAESPLQTDQWTADIMRQIKDG